MEGFNLDTLSIKMVGDPTEYNKSLKEADAETKRAADSLRLSMGSAIDDIGLKVATTGSKLKEASNQAKAYGETIAKSVSTGIGTPSREASGAVGGLSSQMSSFGSIISSIPFGAIAAGIGSMFMAFIKGIQDIEQLDLKARRLGVTVTELKSAMTWSGAAGSSVTQAIANVNKAITQSQLGQTQPTKDLQSLSAASGMGKAESFSDVVKQLSAIRDEGTRTAMAFRLLGDNASDFLDVLARPGGMKDAEATVKRLGMGASEADLANVKAVAQTIRELQMIWTGFVNQVILGIAPFARALSEAFDPGNINLTWIKDTIFQVGRGIFIMGAFMVEAAKDSQLLWEGMQAGLKVVMVGFNQLKAVALDVFAEIAKAFVKVFNETIAGQFKKWGDVEGESGPLNKALKSLGTGLGKQFEIKGDPSGELRKLADEARKLSKVQVKEAHKQLIDIGIKVSKTDTGKFLDSLIDKVKKFSDEGVKGIDKISNRQSLLIKTMEGELATMRKGLQLPGQQFMQDVRKIFSLRGERNLFVDPKDITGVSRIRTPLDFGKPFKKLTEAGAFHEEAVKNVGPDILKTLPGLEQQLLFQQFQKLIQQSQIPFVPQLSSAAQFRSQEAVSAEAKFQMEGQRPGVQEQIKQALDLANEQRKSQIILGNQVLEALKKLGGMLKDEKELN